MEKAKNSVYDLKLYIENLFWKSDMSSHFFNILAAQTFRFVAWTQTTTSTRL